MALHDSLRELVSVRGAGVSRRGGGVPGALDDFLSEDEATLGELNLLVDAVRLGALRRVLDVMAHGAGPEAAVREAGAQLARDRGTDDPTRSCWALATLCFALGKLDEPLVRMFRADAGTISAPDRPPGPQGSAPPPVVSGPGTAERPETRVLSGDVPGPSAPGPTPQPAPVASPEPTVAGQPPPQYVGPVPPVIPEERSSRTGTYLLVVLVALLFGGLVAAGIILLRSDDAGSHDDTTATDGSTPATTGAGARGRTSRRWSPPTRCSSRTRTTTTRRRSTRSTRSTAATKRSPRDPLDSLPTISPDRRTMTYEFGPGR